MRGLLPPPRLALAMAALIALDWASKLLLLRRVPLGETHPVIDGWLYFAHRQNTGVAFSLLADLPAPWGMVALSAFSAGAVLLFLRMLAATPDRVARVAMALVVAGAVGNLGDRLASGSVTDFVLVPFFPFVFNVADAAITVGGIVLVLRMLSGAVSATPDAASAGS
jgi:signal peptidase II